jgi:hypothetical protein
MEAVENPMINLFAVQVENQIKYENSSARFTGKVAECDLCGRKLSQKPNSQWMVEIGIDGFELGRTDETESQGFWLLGSECRKMFPTAVKAGK